MGNEEKNSLSLSQAVIIASHAADWAGGARGGDTIKYRAVLDNFNIIVQAYVTFFKEREKEYELIIESPVEHAEAGKVFNICRYKEKKAKGYVQGAIEGVYRIAEQSYQVKANEENTRRNAQLKEILDNARGVADDLIREEKRKQEI